MNRSPGREFEPSDSALLETLLLEAPVAFAFYDLGLRYRRINRMLAEINGLPMGAHIGRRPRDLLPPELAVEVETMLQRVLDTGQAVVDRNVTVASPGTGERRHYQSQWFPARDGGEIIGVAVLVTDVTDSRRSEDALRRSQDRTLRLLKISSALAGALTIEDVSAVVAGECRASLDAVECELLVGSGSANGNGSGNGNGNGNGARVNERTEGTLAHEVTLALEIAGTRVGTLRLVLPLVRSAEPSGTDSVAAATDAAGSADTDQAEVSADRVFLEALAGQFAIALERAKLYERERATAVALQLSLLPDRLPDAPGVELAASFRPGSAEAEVGGDWYDAFTLPDGRLVLVVGDVMGKGVIAAAGMGRLRSALRALAFVDASPAAVLAGLDRVFTATEEPDQIATLVYLLVNPATRRVAVGAAGHLPLVLLRPGVPPRLVDAGSGSTPLGWPEHRHQRILKLGVGDILIGLTDGVVERRGYDLDEGLLEVLDCAAAPAADLPELVERVANTMLGRTAGRDDATLLAVRFGG